jgi:hypothetical protein
MVRSRVLNAEEHVFEKVSDQKQGSSQGTSQESLVDMFQEIMRLLKSSNLRTKNARYI